MLALINAEREKAGVPPLELGTNKAVQLHAEASLANCFASHWGADGLTPYMRYSLMDGYQLGRESFWGFNYCIKAIDGYAPVDVVAETTDATEFLTNDYDYGPIFLYKYFKKVNIGLAWNDFNFVAYQYFEGDYVEYDAVPKIEEGKLSLSGKVKNGFGFSEDPDFGIMIYYDPPPHSLTRGQLSRTYCYDFGRPVGMVVEPPPPGFRKDTDNIFVPQTPCPNPYEVPRDATPPASSEEDGDLWEEIVIASYEMGQQNYPIKVVIASEWSVQTEAFFASADISDVLREYGNGVYTIRLFGKIDGEDNVFSTYSIFHGITPPDTYTSKPVGSE